jgi:glycine hydroxymethyltransferase
LILSTEELAKKIDSAVFPGTQGGPLMHAIAAKAVAFGEALQPEFRAMPSACWTTPRPWPGLVEEGVRLVSGGTDNHLLLVDLRPVGVTGKAAELALDNAGIHTNKNMIPYDPEKPMITSGIRVGTPAITTRGFGPAEMRQVAAWFGEIVRDVENEALQARIQREVQTLCQCFPVPV